MNVLRIGAIGCAAALLLGAGPVWGVLDGFTVTSAAAEREHERAYLDIPSAAGARQNALVIQRRPHYAGSGGDRELALATRDLLAQYGFDAALESFSARVATPHHLGLEIEPDGKPFVPRSSLRNGPRNVPIGLNLREVPLASDPPTADAEVSTPFNSGSGDGDVWAPFVYAGRGTTADFDTLGRAHVDVRGAIVLVRYGAEFRGLLAERAQAHGAAGVLFYSDPKDDGFARGPAYPAGPWRPATAVQRGSVGSRIHIPTLPISALNAQRILAYSRGVAGPPAWSGAMNGPYLLGRSVALVHLVVKLDRKQTTLWNTVGRLRGSDDLHPVILGAHRDAWVYGVSDNGDGVTVLLEVARGLGYLAKSGWQPKRSIVIGFWDGEEIGEAGSTEYVRSHANELTRAVAYLNADENLTGTHFGADGAAAIAPAILAATLAVPDPGSLSTTLFARWQKEPKGAVVAIPGGGSDHEPFLFEAGIPVTGGIGFRGPFGAYHSSYDTLAYAEKFADPGFVLHRTAAQVYGILALRLAGADVIPYQFSGYTPLLHSGYLRIATRIQALHLNVDLSDLKRAIDRFARAAAGIDPAIASAQIDLPDNELVAVRSLDSIVYGANGYASDVFPQVNAALDAGDDPSVTAAVARTTGAIAAAANALGGRGV
ncbi:MAG: M28 family peptidase [Candidatus Velthaea sp.]